MITRPRCAVVCVLPVLLMVALAAPAGGQTPPYPAPLAADCNRPIQCPPHTSGNGFTTLSIHNAVQNGTNTCKFAEPRLDPLVTFTGSDASWQICNACDQPIIVVLNTWDGQWWESFEVTTPLPQLDGTVSMTIPCRNWGSIDGRRATAEGRFNYKAHVKLTAVSPPADTIDPQLQIKRGGGLTPTAILGLGLSLLIGAAMGYWWARRR